MAGISKRDKVILEVGKLRGKFTEKVVGDAMARIQSSGISALDALLELQAVDADSTKEILGELAKLTFRCSECGRDDLLLPNEPPPSPKRCETCRQRAREKNAAAGKPAGPPSAKPPAKKPSQKLGPAPAAPVAPTTAPTAAPSGALEPPRRRTTGALKVPDVEGAAPAPAPADAPPPIDDGDEAPAFKSHSTDMRRSGPGAIPAPLSDDGEEAPAFKSHSTDMRQSGPGAIPAPLAPDNAHDDMAFTDEVGGTSSASASALDLQASSSQRLTRKSLEELKGATIGDCVLEQLIGRGAMGSVFVAHHQKLNRKVALKLLEQKLAADVKFVNRFFQEARALTLLDNPHVVRVFGFDKDDTGRHYIVMEYLDGGSVAGLLKRKGKLEIDEAVRIGSEAAKGLHAAHRTDLVHRDVKPANLMLTKEGRVKVVDFGLAVPTTGEVFLATEVVGTPVYMAPEQADGLRLDGRCDQYALGITLYQLICGRPPFNQRKPVDVITAHMKDPPPPPHELRDDTPAWLEDVILKMLAKSPNERFESMAEVFQALESRGVGAKPISREALARPALSIDPSKILELDSRGVKGGEVAMPGWALPASVALIAIAASIVFLLGTSGAATADEVASGAPHVLERRIAEARSRIQTGGPTDVAAALERVDSDLEALGAGAGAPELRDLKKECETKLDEFRKQTQGEVRGHVLELVGKHRYAAAIEAVTADSALVAALKLDGFLADLRGEALGTLEREQGEDYVPAGPWKVGPLGEPATLAGFYLEHTEVTIDAFAKAVEQGKVPAPTSWKGGKPPAGSGQRPVTAVTFDEAQAYAKALGKRLPTGLEFEKAARGRDDARPWPWGPTFVSGKANVLDGGTGALEDVNARGTDVSPFGIVGLAGNAVEWVVGPEGSLVAGGGFGSDALACRVFTRVPLDPKTRDAAVGFRCARDLEPKD